MQMSTHLQLHSYPHHDHPSIDPFLGSLLSQYPWPPPLRRLLLLMPLLKRHRLSMIPPHIIQILHLVNADDPVLASEGLLEGVELGPFGRHARAADAVLGLARREEGVVAVVGHFVPAGLVSEGNGISEGERLT